MRQEDRLGRVASQVEQQRIAMDKIQSQLRILADEVSRAPGPELIILVELRAETRTGPAIHSACDHRPGRGEPQQHDRRGSQATCSRSQTEEKFLRTEELIRTTGGTSHRHGSGPSTRSDWRVETGRSSHANAIKTAFSCKLRSCGYTTPTQGATCADL